MSATLDRHTLVWIRPGERAGIYTRAGDEVRRDALRRWFGHDWPLVVRRSDSVRIDHVALGLPLPPNEAKQRLCFEVDDCAIGRSTPPLRLDVAALRLSDPWQRPLLALERQATSHGMALRVYGSVAWQALTGLNYITAQSDVDLLCHPVDRGQLETFLEMVVLWEARHGVRADGEVVFPDGAAVAWRELHGVSAGNRVLVKRTHAAELLPRSVVTRALPGRAQRNVA